MSIIFIFLNSNPVFSKIQEQFSQTKDTFLSFPSFSARDKCAHVLTEDPTIIIFLSVFRSNFNDLCNYLINQIIYLCRNTIDITTVLDYDYKDIAQLIHQSLQCCECFISEFQEVSRFTG